MRLVAPLPTRPTNGHPESWALFECPYCGQQVERRLTSGRKSKSCGCSKIQLTAAGLTRHGDKPRKPTSSSNRRLHAIWVSMRERCRNKTSRNYRFYGAKGITVCQEWQDYIVFREWALSNGYAPNLTIDRIKTNGPYEPDNCRWVTRADNARFKSNTRLNFELADEIRAAFAAGATIGSIARNHCVPYSTVHSVIHGGTWNRLKGEDR